MSKTKKVNKTRLGMNGETLHITSESISDKKLTMKEAIKSGLLIVDSKKAMQKLFSEEELEEMGYDYTEK